MGSTNPLLFKIAVGNQLLCPPVKGICTSLENWKFENLQKYPIVFSFIKGVPGNMFEKYGNAQWALSGELLFKSCAKLHRPWKGFTQALSRWCLFLDARLGRSYEFTLLCWLIDISGKRSLVFAEILHSIRNLKTEKVTWSWFPPKKSCLPKLSFFISHKIFIEVTSNEECQFRFPMHTVFLGRYWYTRYRSICFHLIRFQDSLIISIPGSNASISLIYCMGISVKKK